MSATATRTRKPLTEVHGTCSWLRDAANGNRQIRVNDTVYELEPLDGGYRLYRFKDGEVIAYDIETQTTWGGWECSCPDNTFRGGRPGGCKHIRSLQALLAQQAAA